MISLLLIPLFVFATAAILGAFVVHLATPVIAHFRPPFEDCFIAAIVSTVIAVVLYRLLGAGMALAAHGIPLLASWLVNAFVINRMVRNGGAEMGLGKAMLVSVAEYVIYIVFAILFAVLVGGAVMGVMSAMQH